MPNMEMLISSSNKTKLLKSRSINVQNTDSNVCACKAKNRECPIEDHCLDECVIYEAIVTTANNEKHYIGCTKNSFRLRWQAHKSNFRLPAYKTETSLSRYVWELQDAGTEYSLKWKIIDRVKSSSITSKNCNLCATEKLKILEMNENSRINKFSELLSRCRHKDTFKLKSVNYTKEIDILSHTIQKERTMRPVLQKTDN